MGEVARLEELRRSVEEDLLDARLSAGEHRARSPSPARRSWPSSGCASDGGRSSRSRYWCGRQGDACSARCGGPTKRSSSRLGIEPGTQVLALELGIVKNIGRSRLLIAPVVTDTCPCSKGLAPYD